VLQKAVCKMLVKLTTDVSARFMSIFAKSICDTFVFFGKIVTEKQILYKKLICC